MFLFWITMEMLQFLFAEFESDMYRVALEAFGRRAKSMAGIWRPRNNNKDHMTKANMKQLEPPQGWGVSGLPRTG